MIKVQQTLNLMRAPIAYRGDLASVMLAIRHQVGKADMPIAAHYCFILVQNMTLAPITI
jgi:hypothetical protein